MAHRDNVMQKQGFASLSQYYHFARTVGKKIDFSRRMNRLAKYYGIPVKQIGDTITAQLYAAPDPEDPVQMIRDYLQLLEYEYQDLSIPGILAEHIRPTTKKSFFRYGDRNTLSPTISRHYIHTHGTPLDVQAQNLSISFEREITPDDLVAFILTYENPATYKNQVEQDMETLSTAFKQATGATLNPSFAERFQQEYIALNIADSAEKAPF